MTQDVNDKLIARLQELSDRSDALNDQLADPEVVSDPVKCVAVTKELGKLRRLVDPFRKFCKVRGAASPPMKSTSFRRPTTSCSKPSRGRSSATKTPQSGR